MLPAWMLGFDVTAFALPVLEYTAPIGAFLLGPWVGFVCSALAAWLLLDGGVSLLRRAPEARALLLAYAVIVTAGKVSAGLVAIPLFGGVLPLAAGLSWPMFVLAWMLRPAIRREMAGWPPA
jgi:hypothetical protein